MKWPISRILILRNMLLPLAAAMGRSSAELLRSEPAPQEDERE